MKKLTATTLIALLAASTVFGGRKTSQLRDWHFNLGDATDAKNENFDCSRWEKVRIPHDWAIDKPFDMNIDIQYAKVEADGDKTYKLRTRRTGALPCFGVGWYRTSFELDKEEAQKRVFLEFDGAMSLAKIYINSELAGERPYGYSSFCVDATNFVKAGKNQVAVRLDNKEQSSRWYPGAGLYRFVRVVVKEKSHIKYNGIFATTPNVSADSATVKIETEVENPDKLSVEHKIFDKNKKLVAKTKVPAGETALLKVEKPALWSPDSPALYTLKTSLVSGGKTLDEVSTRIGIRSISFSAVDGFKLNGRYTSLKGVCLHHDLGPIGAATNVSAIRRQFEILKEMGCNAIRTTHNPPSPEFLDLCDELGFLVEAEAFDEWKHAKNRDGYWRYFDEWAKRDLTDFVKRDRNHPSIILWSAGNEIPDIVKPDGIGTAKMLVDTFHALDNTRPVTVGINYGRQVFSQGNGEFAKIFDVVGVNYNPWTCRDTIPKKFPEMIVHGSETASTVSSRGIYHLPLKKFKADIISKKMPFSPDYQMSSFDTEAPPWAQILDEQFYILDKNKKLLGEFVWTGFDYLGEPTPFNPGTPARSSYFGIVDLAGFPKDRFYFYQSRWNEKAEVLHILPHWNWEGREGKPIPVICYSNFPEVEVFLNGKSFGKRRLDPNSPELLKRYRFIWDEIPYEAGELKAVAYDAAGNKKLEKVVKTSGQPAAVKFEIKHSKLSANPDELIFVEMSVVDKDGNFCPTATPMLFVKVDGAGRLLALCNGDATDQTAFSSNYMKAFSGKLLAVVKPTGKADEIKIHTISMNLKPSFISVKTK